MSEQVDMTVEVAYATPDKQVIVPLRVTRGCTAIEAVNASAIADQFDGLDVSSAKLGVFGQLVPVDRELREGDRVEIYRPLIADPKQVRKERAARIRKARQ